MSRRVLFWLGCTVLGGCLPFLLPMLAAPLRPGEPPPSLADLLGGGEGLLVAVAWCAAGIAEMRDAPAARARLRSFFVWASCVVLVGCAFGYGIVLADRTRAVRPARAENARGRRGGIAAAPGPADPFHLPAQRRAAGVVSLGALILGATVSGAAVAVGTPEVRRKCCS
jgi:hypothetical protein